MNMPSIMNNIDCSVQMLIAQASRLQTMSKGVRRRSSSFDTTEVLIGFAVVAGVVLGLSILYMIMNRGERNRRSNSPKGLFRSLCRAHELDRASRRVLGQMAKHQRLAQPARIFLEEERFDKVNLNLALRSQMELIDELRGKIFATDVAA